MRFSVRNNQNERSVMAQLLLRFRITLKKLNGRKHVVHMLYSNVCMRCTGILGCLALTMRPPPRSLAGLMTRKARRRRHKKGRYLHTARCGQYVYYYMWPLHIRILVTYTIVRKV